MYSTTTTIDDGSLAYQYNNFTYCRHKITLNGKKAIVIRFSKFETEQDKDILYFYDQSSTTKELLLALSGTLRDSVYVFNTNKLMVEFITDEENVKKIIDMEQVVIKRKNIDLPVEILQKLSLMAVANGKSLKAYIENILINKANNISIEVSENPSPSNDEWFKNSANLEELERGIGMVKEGKTKYYSVKQLKDLLEE